MIVLIYHLLSNFRKMNEMSPLCYLGGTNKFLNFYCFDKNATFII